MTEVDHALSQVEFIRARMAASTRFQGFAPHAVAITGGLAIAAAAAQSAWPDPFWKHGGGFVIWWTVVAILATGIIATESLGRSRRLHKDMSDTMISGTLRLLLPFGVVGAIVAIAIAKVSPPTIWVLPGLWQMLIALVGLSAVSTLPRTILWAGLWYLVCGATVLLIAGRAGAPAPWMMGLPFGAGQLLVAWILHNAAGEDHDRS